MYQLEMDAEFDGGSRCPSRKTPSRLHCAKRDRRKPGGSGEWDCPARWLRVGLPPWAIARCAGGAGHSGHRAEVVGRCNTTSPGVARRTASSITSACPGLVLEPVALRLRRSSSASRSSRRSRRSRPGSSTAASSNRCARFRRRVSCSPTAGSRWRSRPGRRASSPSWPSRSTVWPPSCDARRIPSVSSSCRSATSSRRRSPRSTVTPSCWPMARSTAGGRPTCSATSRPGCGA